MFIRYRAHIAMVFVQNFLGDKVRFREHASTCKFSDLIQEYFALS